MSLSDNNAALNEVQERITQLQRALTSSEHDRRVLQERLDSTRYVVRLLDWQYSQLFYLETLEHLMINTVKPVLKGSSIYYITVYWVYQ
jgi:hypothetical protein